MHKNRFLHVLVVLVIALLLITTASCELITKVDEETTTQTGTQQTEVTISGPLSDIQITASAPGEYLPSIADVVALVKPSVVSINTEAVAQDFFGRSVPQAGAGSGWIISSDGLIITNNHVVEGAQTINVTFYDGTTLSVELSQVASDSISDLAVLKVNAQGLPTVKLGDSTRLRVGDWVVAIGNSLGEGIRATQGIVSRQDVTISDESGQELSGLIETDAAINPGNSGGPLVNMAGEVIGITNAKRVQSGVEGTGYAISTDEALPLIQELIDKGYVTWPFLGVNTYTVNDYVVSLYNLKVDEGVLLTYVEANSPAAKAGLKAGDVVVSFSEQPIVTGAELIRAIHKAKINQPIEMVYWRDSDRITTTVTLIERPR